MNEESEHIIIYEMCGEIFKLLKMKGKRISPELKVIKFANGYLVRTKDDDYYDISINFVDDYVNVFVLSKRFRHASQKREFNIYDIDFEDVAEFISRSIDEISEKCGFTKVDEIGYYGSDDEVRHGDGIGHYGSDDEVRYGDGI